MALDFSKYGTPVEEPTDTPDFSKFGTPVEEEPTEKGGFFGSFGTSLRERAKTAIPALALFGA